MAKWNVQFKCKADGEEKDYGHSVDCHFAHNAPKVAIKELEGTPMEHDVKYNTIEVVVTKA